MGAVRTSTGLLGVLILNSTLAAAGEPLHRAIDRVVEAKLGGEPAAPSTDSEFLRRVCLDLSGMIPTADEARVFLDDPSPYKRERLVDRLLASSAYAWRMADAFDVMLMERRTEAAVAPADWHAYLRRSFAENKPYDRLVAEVLEADGLDPARRAPARFVIDRQAEPNQVTRDVGRIFLGRDLQCAQCHDHPLVDDYKQAHYYGLFAFLNRTSLFDEPGVGKVLAEKAEGDVTFASVFKKGVSHKTGPRLLDAPPVDEPAVAKGAEYRLAPDKAGKVRPIPRVSRRAELAPRLTSGDVPEFNRNIVNRLWALMMGRGLVHPLDMHHDENPPTNPELLELLAKEFVATRFDVRSFLREVALTRAYQRSSEPPPDPTPAPVSPGGANAVLPPLSVAALKTLTPEQLAWSTMQSIGLVGASRRAAELRFDADPRLVAIFATDPKRQALRASMAEDWVRGQLAGSVTPFVRQFAGSAGQPQDATEPTVHQALFLSNGEPVQGWLSQGSDRLVGRLEALTEPSALAEELYLGVLTRRPTADERAEVARYLAGRGKDRAPALRELAWALLASTEFRFNH